MNSLSVFSTSKYCILNCEHHEMSTTENLQPCGIKIQMNKRVFYGNSYVNVYFEGELSNLSHLVKILKTNYENNTHLPEQIIIELYKKYGIDHTLQLLDGIFLFLLYDYNFNNEISSLYVVSDRLGRMPLYTHHHSKKIIISNHASFPEIQTNCFENKASAYTLYHLSSKILSKWEHVQTNIYYTLPANVYLHISNNVSNMQAMYEKYKKKMMNYIENNQNENPFLHMDTIKGINEMDIFDFDFEIRSQLYQQKMPPNSVFYSKEFIAFYFSIPLEIRYHYHAELFTV